MSEQQIPAPILGNLKEAAELDVAAAEADRQSKALDQTIADLESQLAAAKATHSALGRAQAEAVEHAGHYRQMAYGLAQSLDLPHALVAAADTAALKAAEQPAQLPTSAAPELGPNDVRRIGHSTCLHCGVQIMRDASDNGPWVHHFTLNPECREVPGKYATPVPEDDPLGQNGAQEVTR